MLHTIVVYVENKPGVLSRVVSLFRRRAFNIDSLTVGRTEKPEVSRMTIVTDADEDQARRIMEEDPVIAGGFARGELRLQEGRGGGR